MSENERMERARRIRRMREGQRDEDEEQPDDATADETGTADASGTDEDAADASGEASDDPADGDAPTGTAASPESDAAASADGADAGETEADPADPATVDEPNDSGQASAGGDADGDGAVVETVEGAGGTTAELPDAEEMEAALEGETEAAEAPDEAASAGPAGIAGEAATAQESETRVLEFTLGDERYCLDIEYIEEIVKQERITRVPNTPEFVTGVVDLRGQITTILNPKVVIDKDDTQPGELIVVFDAEAFEDQGHIGWVVDDVRQVSPIVDDQVNDPPIEEPYINGVIDREGDDGFVIWTSPEFVLREAD